MKNHTHLELITESMVGQIVNNVLCLGDYIIQEDDIGKYIHASFDEQSGELCVQILDEEDATSN